MTKAEYLAFHAEFMQRMTATTLAKNADYTGGSDSPFANFELVESMKICSTEIGFLTRITDKIARINSFVQNGTLQVKDESVQDTLLDLANYCALMAAYLGSKK